MLRSSPRVMVLPPPWILAREAAIELKGPITHALVVAARQVLTVRHDFKRLDVLVEPSQNLKRSLFSASSIAHLSSRWPARSVSIACDSQIIPQIHPRVDQLLDLSS
jgi:hypothetical protein